MRLLFLSTVYPTPWEPHKGPANRSTVESLRLLGCDVRVVAPVPWTARFGARTAAVPPADHPVYWYPPFLARRFYHRSMWWSIRSTLLAQATAFRPEAILSFWVDPEGTAAVRLGRRLGIPVGIIAGGTDVMILPSRPSRRRVIADTLRRADHVFAVGSEIMRRSVALGADPARVSNFFCGVDLATFGPGDRREARQRLGITHDGPLLLWIGRMTPVKGVDRLVAAMEQLAPRHPGLRLALVGDGPLHGDLLRQVEAVPGLRDRVILPGPVGHERLPLWYQAADLFVLPSRSEGVPNVLLEAMACGLPFVASRVGSIADLLPFGPSRVVPEGDLPALVTAIDEVLRDPAPRPLDPVRYDRLDGARHLLTHLERRT